MLVNASTLGGIFTNFRAVYADSFETFQAEQTALGMMVQTIDSQTREEDLAWIGAVPRMREWIGDRQPADLAAESFSVKPRDFEASIKVLRNDIEDDRLNIYKPKIQDLAREAAQHPLSLACDVLNAANSTLCYDGQYLCDTDHPQVAGMAAFSNKGTSALTYATAKATRLAMRKFADEEGRYLGVMPTHIVCGPDLADTAEELVSSQYKPDSTVANGEPNVLRGLKVLVLPYITGTKWFMVDTTKNVKPLVRVNRKAPEFTAADDPTDASIFMRKEFYYGVDGRYDVVPGWPQAIYGQFP